MVDTSLHKQDGLYQHIRQPPGHSDPLFLHADLCGQDRPDRKDYTEVEIIRKERSDEHGNELWFPAMLGYFNESPYAKANGISGESALIDHFLHRQRLELRICEEVFQGRYTVLPSKNYTDGDWKRH